MPVAGDIVVNLRGAGAAPDKIMRFGNRRGEEAPALATWRHGSTTVATLTYRRYDEHYAHQHSCKLRARPLNPRYDRPGVLRDASGQRVGLTTF